MQHHNIALKGKFLVVAQDSSSIFIVKYITVSLCLCPNALIVGAHTSFAAAKGHATSSAIPSAINRISV